MTDADPHDLGLMAKLVVALAALLIVAGVLWHGITVAVILRICHDLAERPGGPMSFRFILQPLMAAIAATISGLKDARTGRSPHLWSMLHEPGERTARLREGLNATARIVLLGLAMDLIYQIIVLKAFYPVEALIVALLLAVVPYLAIRGAVTRIAPAKRPAASTPQTC